MSNVFDQYPSNGIGPYNITFEYQEQEDVFVLFENKENKLYELQPNNSWSFVNATTIELTAAPDPAVEVIRIQRITDVNPLKAIFYPGSAIRAQDLNDNFEQLMMAVEEGRVNLDTLEEYIDFWIWNKLDDTIDYEEQTTGIANSKLDDDHIFTASAIAARHDAYVQADKPTDLTYEQSGKVWNDTEELDNMFWDDQNKTWLNFVKTGPQGAKGEPGEPGPAGQDGEIQDCPNDGQLYARQRVVNQGNWVAINNIIGGGSTYNFIKPLEEDGTSVKINLYLLNNI